MQEKRESDQRSPSISIGGDVSGPVTVGDSNIVVGSVSEGASVEVSSTKVNQIFTANQRSALKKVGTKEEVESLEEGFQELNREVEEQAPSELQPEAKEQTGQLITALTNEAPDVSAMEKVKTWFVDNLPSLLGTLTGILTHPIVGKLVEAAGEFTLSQFRKRLGLPDTM